MQQYDVVTKMLMDRAAALMIETFLGIQPTEVEQIEELPQESVSLKRSDYILKVIGKDGSIRIVLWEFLSTWKRKAVLNLFEYSLRTLNKFDLPVMPVMLLMKHAEQAINYFEECGMSFRFHLIKLYEMSAMEFLQEADVYLLPFVGIMQGYEQAASEADRKIYESDLPSEEKADLLSALAIFTGFQNPNLASKLAERRRDIMIESPTYALIEKEGFEKGMQQGIQQGFYQGDQQGQLKRARTDIYDVLETRFDKVPRHLLNEINQIDDLRTLEKLLRNAVTVKNMEEFKAVLQKMWEPA